MSDMNGRLALVTGGASGIGKAVVRAFVQKGCRVIIFDVQDEKGENLCNELNKDGEMVFYRHVNLFSNEEIEAGFQWIQSEFGPLDYADKNITVNAIAPGATETELLKGLKVTAPETYRQSELANPAGRLASRGAGQCGYVLVCG